MNDPIALSVKRLLLSLFIALLIMASRIPFAVSNEGNIPTGNFAAEAIPLIDEKASADKHYLSLLPGEVYDTRTGRLGHYMTDLSVSGNGSLDITINRKFAMQAEQPGAGGAIYPHLFGSMALDIPRIEFTSFDSVLHPQDAASNPKPTIEPGATWISSSPSNVCSGLHLLDPDKLFEVKYEEGSFEHYLKRPGKIHNAASYTSNSEPAQPEHLTTGIVFHYDNKKIHFYPRYMNQSTGRFPANAEYVSPDNWYIDCVGTTFNVYRPNGMVYKLNVFEHRNTGYFLPSGDFRLSKTSGGSIVHGISTHISFDVGHKTVFVSQISDNTGNTLNYTYDTVTESVPRWKTISHLLTTSTTERKLLKTISSNDGRVVTITRRAPDSLNCKPLIKSIQYNKDLSHNISYDYTNGSTPGQGKCLLQKVTRADGGVWSYGYFNPLKGKAGTSGTNWDWPKPVASSDSYSSNVGHSLFALQAVTYPEGAKVSYTYKGRYFCDFRQKTGFNRETCNTKNAFIAALATRVISGDLVTGGMGWLFSYGKLGSAGSATNPLRAKTLIETPIINGVRNQHQFEYAVAETGTNPSLASPQSGKLLHYKVMDHSGKVIKQTDWTWGFYGDVVYFPAVYPFDSAWRYWKEQAWQTLHHSRKRVVTKTITKLNGDTFENNYAGFNQFGQATRIGQYHRYRAGGSSGRTLDRKYFNSIEVGHTVWVIGKIERESVDGMDAKILRTFNSKGQMTSETRFGVKHTFVYHANGDLHKIFDGKGVPIKKYENYKLGVPQTERKPGALLTVTVNSKGQVSSRSDWINANNKTSYQYNNLLGKVTKITPPLQASTNIAWPVWHDSSHSRYRKKETTRGSAYLETVYYDTLGRPLIQIERDRISNDKVYKYYRYDRNGRLSYESLPTDQNINISQYFNGTVAAPKGIEYLYDPLGRLTRERNTADNSITSYCYGFDCESIAPFSSTSTVEVKHGVGKIDPDGYFHVVNFRAYGNPDDKEIIQITQQRKHSPIASVTTNIFRDRLNSITKVVQGGITREYTYKPGKRLLASVKHPETGTTQFAQYDPAGNLTKEISADGKATLYNYDDNHLLTDITYPGGTANISYTYDKNEALTGASLSGSTINYHYRADGLLDKETLQVDGESFTLDYNYNQYGFLSKIIYPNALNVNYYYNTLGWLGKVGGFADHMHYFPNGQLKSTTLTNGQNFTSTQTNRKLPARWKANGGHNTAMDQTYAYDRRANVDSLTDHLLPDYSITMDYDGLSRLTRAVGQWGVGTFGYSNSGNITRIRLGPETLTYDFSHTYPGNRTHLLRKVTSTSGLNNYTFDYDYNGNVIDNGRYSFLYDHASRLYHADVNGRIYDFDYDAQGRRIRSVRQDTDNNNNPIAASKVTQYFFYNKDGQLLFEKNKNSAETTLHIYANDKLIAQRRYYNAGIDGDGDGIADFFEHRYGMQPDYPGDAHLDPDNDGLSNFDEFQLSSNVNSTDSDNDGISDTLEALYQLDPIQDDAALDADGDGVTNLNEIIAGTHPDDPLSRQRMQQAMPAIRALMGWH